MELLINLLFIIISVWSSFKNPTIFVCLHLLYHTQFLGFLPTEMLIGGVDVGSFLINCSMFMPIFIKGPNDRLIDKVSLYSIAFFLIFICYGIFKPVFDGNQSLIMGIMAGKSFFAYVFLFYLLLFRQHINYDKIFDCIIVISLFFAFLYIVNFVGIRIVPPCYEKYDFLQCKYDSFMVFSVMVLLYRRMTDNNSRYSSVKIIMLCLGIFLGGYFSLISTTVFIVLFFAVFRRAFTIPEYVGAALFICFYLVVGYLLIEQSDWFINLQHSQFNSIASREKYNAFRWNMIEQQFNWGYGFLYKTSSIVKTLGSEGYAETFSFIDSGYVDLFGRFGIWGTIIFLLYPVLLFIKSFNNRILFPFSVFILQFLCINYTWSVFSFPQGIIVLSLAYIFIVSQTFDVKEYE